MVRDWCREVDKYLKAKYQTVISVSEKYKCLSELTYKTSLELNESRFFMLGLENGLFEIDDEGYTQSPFLPKSKNSLHQQKTFQIFWHSKDKRFLFREGIFQLATLSRLILEEGWGKSQVFLEPVKEDFGTLAYAVDILLKSNDGKVLVAGEVKATTSEFEKLIKGFRYCCGRGDHQKTDCMYSSNHPKYAFCETVRPSYFWAAAPSREACFKLTYVEGKILLKERATLPSRQEIMEH